MNHRHPPPLIHRPTTTQILKQTTGVFSTRHHLLPLLFLSFILLSFRTEMETITHSLTSFVENDPSIKSLFPPIQLPPKPTSNLLRQLTGDDDFFTGNDEVNHRFFGNSFTTKPQLNATPIILDSFNTQLGFSNSKLSFKSIENINTNVSVSVNDRNTEIEQQGLTAFLVLGAFSVSHVFMLLVYVSSQSFIHGIIFVLVVNHILKKHNIFMNTYLKGVILGSKRVGGLILLRWELRDSLTQILSLWFVGIEDQYSVFKILVRLKFLPFSIGFTWVKGFEKEIYGFLLLYFSLDMLISYVFAVCVWVVMADSRRTCREVFREGFYLLSLSINPAINLKCLENIVSGSFAKFILSQVFGEFLASFIQSFMVIYFMVAWMVYYFSMKSMDANSRGISFGQREFEDMLNDDR